MIVTSNNGKKNHKQHHNIKVLMYHKIVDDKEYSPSHWANVSREEFRKHLMLLERWGFTPVTFRDYLLFVKDQLQLPKKPVILTFDDGYEEVYRIAFPMLKDMGWNAVVFVIGDQRIRIDLWNNKLGIGNPTLLNSNQICKMHESGFEIGSHSMTHQFLPNESYINAWYEIAKSKEELQFLLGSKVYSFCYPYGAVNENIKQMVKEAGYSVGCGVYTGPPRFGLDIFDIRRIKIPAGTNTVSFGLKMLTPFEYYEYVGTKIMQKRDEGYSETEFDSEFNSKKIETDRTHINV